MVEVQDEEGVVEEGLGRTTAEGWEALGAGLDRLSGLEKGGDGCLVALRRGAGLEEHEVVVWLMGGRREGWKWIGLEESEMMKLLQRSKVERWW
jgi:hypothetical protein